MPNPPTGTVTFLFTDIEGSTALWEKYPEAMKPALARHDAILCASVESNRGYVVKMRGDGIHAAFSTASDALAAALALQRALCSEFGNWKSEDSVQSATFPVRLPISNLQLRVRSALHTGAVEERDGDYFGPPVNRAARLLSAGHGGQILVSLATQELTCQHLPESISLRDLGEHRLKDLIQPERIFQIVAPDLPADFPPLSTLSSRANNLPAQATPLVGREKELAAVEQLLSRQDVRLVTLSGPGGTGKTRLSLQVAADLLDQFEHGVYFVNLAPVRDPALVMSAIAQALGVRESGDKTLGDLLKDHLREMQAFLLLDNFEQVVSAAPLVADLLAPCPRLKIMVTSREVLRLRGEHEFFVPPLSLPDVENLPSIEQLPQYAAVALFIQRALAVKSDFIITEQNAAAVAKICARLDGLPLAIELAAARCKLLSPQAMLARLENRLGLLTSGARDLPARHQTLRDAIAWSYNLLNDVERKLFARLAVFVGGCTADAVQTICEYENAIDMLASLLDKSLLRVEEMAGGEARFGMLETIREFALECLGDSEETNDLHLRHAQFYLEWMKRARKELLGAQAGTWLNRIEAEHANLRAALAWTLEHDHVDMTVQLNRAIWRFWNIRRYFNEGSRWAQVALQAVRQKQLSAEIMFLALDSAAGWANDQGDYAEARRLHTECLSLQRERGNARGIAISLNNLALVAENQGDYDFAIRLHEESLSLVRQLNEPQLIAAALTNLGNVVQFKGDYERAVALQEESIAIRRTLEDQWGLGITLVNLAEALLYRDDHLRAISLCEECIALHRQMGNEMNTAYPLATLGRAMLGCGDAAQAEKYLRASLALLSKSEDKPSTLDVLTRLGFAAVAQNHYAHGARLLSAQATLRAAIGHPLQPADFSENAQSIDLARAQLGETAFGAAWKEGRAMALEQAIAYALEET